MQKINFQTDSTSHGLMQDSSSHQSPSRHSFAATTTDEDLLFAFKMYTAQERSNQIHILILLQEIEQRQLHLKRGYGGLFDFLVRGFYYSESAAYRRVQTLQLLKKSPQLELKIRSGELNLSVAAQIQNHLNKLEGCDPNFWHAQKDKSQYILDLVENVKGQSTREIQKNLDKQLLMYQNQLGILQDPSEKIKITLQLTPQTMQNMDRLKELLSHVSPSMKYEDLIEYLCDRTLKKIDPVLRKQHGAAPAQKKRRINRPSESRNQKLTSNGKSEPRVVSSRYIPSEVKNKIWIRDGGCCSYVDSLTGQRCHSRHQLQIDHIQPFAMGGDHQEQNLRLLCAQHNRWQATKSFGKRDYH